MTVSLREVVLSVPPSSSHEPGSNRICLKGLLYEMRSVGEMLRTVASTERKFFREELSIPGSCVGALCESASIFYKPVAGNRFLSPCTEEEIESMMFQ